MMIQDRSGAGYQALEGATFAMMGAAAQAPDQVQQVFSTYNTGAPRIQADVDRDRALMMGVQPADVFATLGTYLGSNYINDFNFLGRTFRVTAQAEPAYRDDLSDIGAMKVRSASGAMVPIGSVATLHDDSGPARVVRYNLYPAAELQGQAAPGVSSGEALALMEMMAGQTLAIAGLIQDNVRQQINKLPGLGDIPILGAAMKGQDDLVSRSEVIAKQLEGINRGAITLGPDRFFDDRVFDPDAIGEYLKGFNP